LSPVLPDQVRDYRLLLERWHRAVRGLNGTSLSIYGEAAGYPLAVVLTAEPDPGKPSLYLSAGIHGDEPAGVEGLIRWFSEFPELHGSFNWMIFPCLNPWGLERNVRTDAEGNDLNRFYNSRKIQQIKAQKSLMGGWRFSAAAHLHEDYDARGFYLYEINAGRPYFGERLRDTIAGVFPPDPRKTIDGHRSNNGLIRRRVTRDLMKGHPEAFFLHFHHAQRTFTFETPSESDLFLRVSAQKSFLKALAAILI
jgi:murein peptide amidase A